MSLNPGSSQQEEEGNGFISGRSVIPNLYLEQVLSEAERLIAVDNDSDYTVNSESSVDEASDDDSVYETQPTSSQTNQSQNNTEFTPIDITSEDEVEAEEDDMPRTTDHDGGDNGSLNARQNSRAQFNSWSTSRQGNNANRGRRPRNPAPHSSTRSQSRDGGSPSSKRQRISAAGAHVERSSNTNHNDKTIEEIDLVDDDLAGSLRKQREDQIQSQTQQSEEGTRIGKSKLNTFQCTICLDNPKDLTATKCGHLFCRDCLLDWMSEAEKNTGRRPNCPACRNPLSRSHKNNIVALEIMKKTVGKPPAL